MRNLILALLLLAAGVPVAEVTFPNHDHAADPTGRRDVVYRELDYESGQDPHELSLLDLRSGERRRLLTFGRHAAVLWSSDGNSLAITDWGGSDVSTVYVFLAESTQGPVDLDEELTRTFGPLPELKKNHHVYLEAVRWQNSRTLRFRLSGYGDHDQNGFDELFDYSLGGKIRRAGGARPR